MEPQIWKDDTYIAYQRFVHGRGD